jgi:hypothetical protein
MSDIFSDVLDIIEQQERAGEEADKAAGYATTAPLGLTELRSFCRGWGFDVEDPDHNALPAVVFDRVIDDARTKFGGVFARFVAKVTGDCDGYVFVDADSWADLWQAWLKATGHDRCARIGRRPRRTR